MARDTELQTDREVLARAEKLLRVYASWPSDMALVDIAGHVEDDLTLGDLRHLAFTLSTAILAAEDEKRLRPIEKRASA